MEGTVCDPQWLRDVGQQDMPGIANALQAARSALLGTVDDWSSAFHEDNTASGSMYDGTREAWSSVCWSYFYSLLEAATRLDHAGQALLDMADTYCASDDGTARDLTGVFELHDIGGTPED
jgi:hypothetical protein